MSLITVEQGDRSKIVPKEAEEEAEKKENCQRRSKQGREGGWRGVPGKKAQNPRDRTVVSCLPPTAVKDKVTLGRPNSKAVKID